MEDIDGVGNPDEPVHHAIWPVEQTGREADHEKRPAEGCQRAAGQPQPHGRGIYRVGIVRECPVRQH